MAIFNRILTVLILLLAIAAAVFSYLLFERRHEFRDRADKLADNLSDIAQIIDTDSNTSYSKQLTFFPATEDQPSSGSLSWQGYHEARDPETGEYAEFDRRIEAGTRAAEALNKQRTFLADKFSQTGITLGIEEADAQSADLRDLAHEDLYKSTSEKILGQAEAVVARDAAMIRTLASLGDSIGHPIERDPFEERSVSLDEDQGEVEKGPYEIGPVLTSLEQNVSGLRERCDEYALVLAEDIFSKIDEFEWNADPNAIKDETAYGAGLSALRQDFVKINGELTRLEVVERQLEETDRDLAKTEETLIATKDALRLSQNRAKDLAREVARLRKEKTGDLATGVTLADEDALKNLRGEVLEVNKDWGFVITDLGVGEINPGMELLVADGKEFVARVTVTRILPDVSVAEIQPELTEGEIKVGNRLILPKEETQ